MSEIPNQDELLTEDTEQNGDEVDDALTAAAKSIVTQPFDWQVRGVFDMEQDGSLVLQPDFQRNAIWDDGKASRLIESVLLSVPLPIFYLAEDADGRYSVIDGQQRLNSIVRFLKNEYALRGLRVLPHLKNKKFQHLAAGDQRSIRNGFIRGTIIKKESDPLIRFEIFERLNTGAVALNDQELRNCVYRGPFNDMLKRLEQYPDWLKLMNLKTPDRRMRDRQLILRFFALHHRYNLYGSNMKRFLNDEMAEKQHASKDQIDACDALFKKVVRMALAVFGDCAFRRFVGGTKDDPNGQWQPKVNLAVFDVVMCGFTQFEERDVVPRADAIREAMLRLMVESKAFSDAISYGTNKKDNLRCRMRLWEQELSAICKSSASGPRVYPFSLKKALFDQNPTCHLCKNRIVLVDDAAVDHDHPWSLGGDTTVGNAKLSHRYCNMAKGNRVE